MQVYRGARMQGVQVVQGQKGAMDVRVQGHRDAKTGARVARTGTNCARVQKCNHVAKLSVVLVN